MQLIIVLLSPNFIIRLENNMNKKSDFSELKLRNNPKLSNNYNIFFFF